MRASREGDSESTLQFVPAPTSSGPELDASHVHNYAARARVSTEYPAILDCVRGAVRLVYDSEKSLVNNGVISTSQTNLIALEKRLLDVSAIGQATQGVFYMFVVGTENSKFVRFFESGSFIGFHHHHKDCETFPASLTGHGYRVYTEEDIIQRSQRKTSLVERQRAVRPQVKRRNRSNQVYSRELGHIKKHIEVLKKVAADLCCKLQLRMFLHIVRNNADFNNPDHRYVHSFGLNTQEQMYLEKTLQDFRLDGTSSYPTLETLASASVPLQPLSLQNQLDVLSSLSNDPFQLYPTLSGVMSQASSKVGLMRFISYQMPAGNGEDSSPKMLPASFRNRFIYFQCNNRVYQCRQLLKHVFSGNSSAGLSVPAVSRTEEYQPPSPPTIREATQPVVKITAELLNQQRVPFCAPSTALLPMEPYANFRTKLVEVGCILWRLHTEEVDLFILNEYADGGEVIPNSFVDVEYESREGTVSCTCASYMVIHGNERPHAYASPDGMFCMHCRFFREKIQPRLQSCTDERNTDEQLDSVQEKINNSRVFTNNVVVPLTTSHGTSKYSVCSRNGLKCATVHVSATGVMVTCTSGTCQAVQRHKRSVNGLLKLQDTSNTVCEHLGAMQANREVWAPRQVQSEAIEEDEDTSLDDDSENLDTPVLDQKKLKMGNIQPTVPAKENEKTYQLEDTLPSLPVPSLDKTLHKYLESAKVFATTEELEKTMKLIQEFENGIGPQLQEKLEEKAKNSRNWLETWWETVAYLSDREPMAVVHCLAGPAAINQTFWPPTEGTQLKRAAQSMYQFTAYLLLNRREEIPIMRDRGGKYVFSMWQYHNALCTSRVPGEPIDSLVRYFKTEEEGPCPSHIAVFCNGHIFKVEMLDESGNQFGSCEIERQLAYIKEQSASRGQGIGVLTADDRTSWAKAYAHLLSLDPQNKENMEIIQSAIITVSLDSESPGSLTEGFRTAMAGSNAEDRWFDKSMGAIYFENGTIGLLGDHCPYEGLVASLIEAWVEEQIITATTPYMGSPEVQSDDVKPAELIFKIDDKISQAKEHAAETYKKNASRMDICASFFTMFGRNFAKEQSIHPDVFFQLAIQLTYYTKYGRSVPCYETATTRQFYHGRTETVRSTTQEAVNFCKAMNNPDVSAKEKMSLLKVAATKQMIMGFEAFQGLGIDRHLLGLYMVSREMGIETPEIFTDPLFFKSGGNGNFILSTSLTGYERGFGGVAPMHKDGYGVFYNLCKEEFYIIVSSFKDSPSTNSLEFFQELSNSLVRMRKMVLQAKK